MSRSRPRIAKQDPADTVIAGIAVFALLLIGTGAFGPIISTLAGEAFGRPSRCGNRICNLQESSLSCPTDCSCSPSGSAPKAWLGTASCCPGLGPSNGVCCPLGTIWDGTTCAPRVAREGTAAKITCTADMRTGGGAWVACPAMYAPVCIYDKNGQVMATLPSDCQACVNSQVAFYIRGECPGR